MNQPIEKTPLKKESLISKREIDRLSLGIDESALQTEKHSLRQAGWHPQCSTLSPLIL
jgi:hypothetical protein